MHIPMGSLAQGGNFAGKGTSDDAQRYFWLLHCGGHCCLLWVESRADAEHPVTYRTVPHSKDHVAWTGVTTGTLPTCQVAQGGSLFKRLDLAN